METTEVRLTVPVEWAEHLRDPSTALEILSLGLEEYRIRRALHLYTEGVGSIGYVAELVGLPVRVLLEEARRRGVSPHTDPEFLTKDLQDPYANGGQ